MTAATTISSTVVSGDSGSPFSGKSSPHNTSSVFVSRSDPRTGDRFAPFLSFFSGMSLMRGARGIARMHAEHNPDRINGLSPPHFLHNAMSMYFKLDCNEVLHGK